MYSFAALRTMMSAWLLLRGICINAITTTGLTVEVNGYTYYIPGKPFASISSSLVAGKDSLNPVTVVQTGSSALSLGTLEAVINSFGQLDDVWNTGFSSGKHAFLRDIERQGRQTQLRNRYTSLQHGSIGQQLHHRCWFRLFEHNIAPAWAIVSRHPPRPLRSIIFRRSVPAISTLCRYRRSLHTAIDTIFDKCRGVCCSPSNSPRN